MDDTVIPGQRIGLPFLRKHYGAAYAITVDGGKYWAHPSYGPSREPLEADSAAELLRLLRQRRSHFGVGDEDGMST